MCRHKRCQNGFTLIELLVAIGIISLLLAMILPAAQHAREGARRTQCGNSLRQVGLALHTYHDTHAVFPLNYGNGPYDETNTGASWIQMILPVLDQTPLYNRIRFGSPLADPENTAVAQTVVPLLLCQSDAGNNGLMDGRYNVAGTWAISSYKACLGSNWDRGAFSPSISRVGRNANDPDGLDHCNGFLCRKREPADYDHADAGHSRRSESDIRDRRERPRMVQSYVVVLLQRLHGNVRHPAQLPPGTRSWSRFLARASRIQEPPSGRRLLQLRRWQCAVCRRTDRR